MEFVLSIAVLILIFWVYSLSTRVRNLEQQERRTTITKTETVTPPEPPQVAPHKPSPEPRQAQPTANAARVRAEDVHPKTRHEPSAFELWIRENTLTKIGAALFFLGIAWFVSYAITQGWITPPMRIVLGFGIALGAYAFGLFRIRTSQDQGLIFTALGSAIVIVTVYAAQFFFEMFMPLVALSIISVSIAYTVFIAVQQKTEWLAIAAAIGGFIAPLLVNEPDPSFGAFFSYLLVFTVAFLALTLVTQWRITTLVLFIGVTFHQLVYYALHVEEMRTEPLFLLLMVLFSFVFLSASLISAFRSARVEYTDLSVNAMNGMILLLWIQQLVIESFQGVVAFIAAALVSIIAATLYQVNAQRELTLVYLGLAILFVFAGTAFELSGYTLALAFAIEVGFILILSLKLRFSENITTTASLLFLLPIITSFGAFVSDDWDAGVLHESGYALYAICAVAFSVGWYALRLHRTQTTLAPIHGQFAYGFLFISWLYLMGIVYLVTHALLSDGHAHAVTLTTLSAVSYAALFVGTRYACSGGTAQLIAATFIPPTVYSIGAYMSSAWSDSWLHPEALGLYAFTFILVLAAILLRVHYTLNRAVKEFDTLSLLLFIVSGVSGTVLVWLIAHAIVDVKDYAVMLSLFVYTVAGLFLYGFGRQREEARLKLAAGIVLAGVLARLILIDVWNMEVFWRIITFVGVGVLFMAATFFERPFARTSSSLENKADDPQEKNVSE